MKPQQYAKALVGACIAALSVLSGAIGDGISAQEWIATASAFLVGLGLVYAVPNRAPAGQLSDPNLSEQDNVDGAAGLMG